MPLASYKSLEAQAHSVLSLFIDDFAFRMPMVTGF